MYEPNTEVHLLSVPLTLDNSNQLTFSSAGVQESYFKSHIVKGWTNFTYQRDNNMILVPCNINNIYNCNYVMYRNNKFNNKYFYAYINKLVYVNEETTGVEIETDVFQTWQFKLNYHKSFIVRQTPIDFKSINTLKDEPDEGQLSVTKKEACFLNGCYLVFCSSDVTQDDTSSSENLGCRIGNAYFPSQVWYFADGNTMNTKLLQWSNAGRGDRILCAAYIPYRSSLLTLERYDDGSLKQLNAYDNKDDITINIPEVEYGKILSYPYSYIEIEDTITGQTRIYSLDKFEDPYNPSFEIQGDICENPSYKIIPKNYLGKDKNYKESLVINCSTNLPVTNNLYANYMMKNNNTIQAGVFSASLGAGMSMISGNIGGVVGSFDSIVHQVSRIADSKKLGNQTTNLSDSAAQRINFLSQIRINYYTMDSNHLNMCCNFWKMFGYPVNSLEIPNINGNENYNYIKMINPNITGDIPQDDMLKIKDMFSNGITLWHTTDGFLNY